MRATEPNTLNNRFMLATIEAHKEHRHKQNRDVDQ